VRKNVSCGMGLSKNPYLRNKYNVFPPRERHLFPELMFDTLPDKQTMSLRKDPILLPHSTPNLILCRNLKNLKGKTAKRFQERRFNFFIYHYSITFTYTCSHIHSQSHEQTNIQCINKIYFRPYSHETS